MVAQNEVVVTIAYQVQIGEAKGSMSICLPIVTLDSVIDKFIPASQSSNDEDPAARDPLLEAIGRIKLDITTELKPLRVGYGDLTSLQVGDVIRTKHRTDTPAEIRIGGLKKFEGTLAADNGQLVTRIERTT